MHSLVNAIQSIVSINTTEAEQIQKLFKEKSFKKGSFFLAEGEICKHAGFIVNGLMRYYINHEGEERTYSFARENEFICNYESFIPKTPSTKIIQALEDCQILQITYPDLQLLYRTIREGERLGRIIIEQVFIQTLQELSSFYTDTSEYRYRQFIEKHPDLQQRVSQYHIASYIGVKPQSLSRIRRRISGLG